MLTGDSNQDNNNCLQFIDEHEYGSLRGIYRIRNTITGRSYYGQTGENFKRRYWHHKWKLNEGNHDNQHLQSAFNKYGEENFVFEIVEIITENDKLDEREIHYISTCDNNYNILGGGGGRRGVHMSEHAKRLVGEANRKHMTGRKASNETRAKMSKSQSIRYNNPSIVERSIDDPTAKKIKETLVKGCKSREIVNALQVPYKVINGILSYNIYKHVEVGGWDEFQSSRKRVKRLTREDANKIRELYLTGHTVKDLSRMYNKTPGTIQNIISLRTFK